MTAFEPLYRRDRSRLPAAERRHQILEAASELLGECGFWGLSLQDVADRCGVTVPGLLRHVGSKAGLMIAVLDHRDTEDARALGMHLGLTAGPGTGTDADPGPQVRVDLGRLCAATMRRDAAQPGIVRLFAVLEAESLAPDHPAHEYFEARQQRRLSQLARLAKDLTPHPETLARLVMATMDGIRTQWLRTGTTSDLAGEWEAASRTLFARAHR